MAGKRYFEASWERPCSQFLAKTPVVAWRLEVSDPILPSFSETTKTIFHTRFQCISYANTMRFCLDASITLNFVSVTNTPNQIAYSTIYVYQINIWTYKKHVRPMHPGFKMTMNPFRLFSFLLNVFLQKHSIHNQIPHEKSSHKLSAFCQLKCSFH